METVARHWNTLLPEGTYRMTVVGAERRQSGVTERYFWDLSLVLEGYDRLEHDFFSEHENAKWKLAQFELEFPEELDNLQGTTYLVEYTHEEFGGETRGKIRQYLAKATS